MSNMLISPEFRAPKTIQTLLGFPGLGRGQTGTVWRAESAGDHGEGPESPKIRISEIFEKKNETRKSEVANFDSLYLDDLRSDFFFTNSIFLYFMKITFYRKMHIDFPESLQQKVTNTL